MMLTAEELTRLQEAAATAFKIPFVDDVEDFVWEAVWAHTKRLPALATDRTKRLFDVVDARRGIGWSAKTLKWNLAVTSCEFVIQRADVFDKAELLGFPGLSPESPPQEIGNAVVHHWRAKIVADMAHQGVSDARIALLLKSADRRMLVPYEEPLPIPEAGDIRWAWTSSAKKGLQGFRDQELVYRWYRNQKQLFEIVRLPPHQVAVPVPTRRLSVEEVIRRLAD
jgi:hypothetical protein